MNRRDFFRKATLAAAALAVDPEQLLWTPKKTIFIPNAPKLPDQWIRINDEVWYFNRDSAWSSDSSQTYQLSITGYAYLDEAARLPDGYGVSLAG